ncbi:hypothetical protein I215_02088 [Galbibacter marinus]|uniref:Uncharacterized protein n=2 Tax=Galbibacter marinus TaxID=555500 RepID=K2PY13_9FLAO|nr:hypothetical protein I215_02088 [Galbibacter marinus]
MKYSFILATGNPFVQFLIKKKMKKFVLGVLLLSITLGIYSCSNDAVSDTESLYQHQANDDLGSNGGDPDDPEGD